ncbi:MAG: hypothetical protein QF535_18825, partial [Anaerolineales bacterium]|nr:hypothetical protein [Anaerolineales bacterium]
MSAVITADWASGFWSEVVSGFACCADVLGVACGASGVAGVTGVGGAVREEFVWAYCGACNFIMM